MITINGTVIAEIHDEYGVMWNDGDENWDLEEDDARDIAWQFNGAALLRRRVFISEAEVVG